MTLNLSKVRTDDARVISRWEFPVARGTATSGDLVDMQVWRRVSASGPEQNRRVLVWLASHVLHDGRSADRLASALEAWARESEPRCEDDAMLSCEDQGARAAAEYSRLLRERGVLGEVYRIPDSRAYRLVLRVVFAYRPSLDERIAVGDTVGDLMDRYPGLSIDVMTLSPQELLRSPLPEHAVKAAREGA
ncbi:MAG: hypothetical protein BWY85_01394 [Firmicutes bacterium ADurb.Bin506]|nr:MAG: hypothetical protein BWY85_01394 [Firmicutes bacterium ADurb.Bin506]